MFHIFGGVFECIYIYIKLFADERGLQVSSVMKGENFVHDQDSGEDLVESMQLPFSCFILDPSSCNDRLLVGFVSWLV